MESQAAAHRIPAAKQAITQLSVYGVGAGALLLLASWLLKYFPLPRR